MHTFYTTLDSFNPTDAQTTSLLTLLPNSARARILRYRRQEDRHRSLLGWLLLFRWKETAGFAGRVLEDLVGVGEGGKPFFKPTGEPSTPTHVDYNITHDENLVMFSVKTYRDSNRSPSPTSPVPENTSEHISRSDNMKKKRNRQAPMIGVDCMRLDREVNELKALDEVLSDQLGEHEQRFIPHFKGPTLDISPYADNSLRERMDHLLTLWTVKEAYTKMLGCGLSMDFQTVQVIFHDSLQRLLFTPPTGTDTGSSSNSDVKTTSTSTPTEQIDSRYNQRKRCHLCDPAAMSIHLDGRDLKQTSSGLSYQLHARLGKITTELRRWTHSDDSRDDNRNRKGTQEYVWACVWYAEAGDGVDCESWSLTRVDADELCALASETT
ncbi:hypothetical protein HD553DRAFT_322217 [Filobasidium floriforme]|uniref:uncharacterized protein n=1 Tax=Filobasidium floriforme TaxID=5210 RepID=UPI001E8DFDB6|nr:uncharacterized protein HD553DRAFT_322217 [Filobasidium floriforme]KAH8088300.1 hypothetical protein HD553DRAFT_322217 [Filobasidium floriforme]